MNNRAEAFKKFLEGKNINSFQVNEFENNEFNTVVFRSNLDIKGQKLPILVILDDSIYGMIRVFVAAKALNKDNETELRIGINELNKTYKSFKYYFDNEDNLISFISPKSSIFFTTCGTKSRFTRNFKFMSATAQRALINNESFIN